MTYPRTIAESEKRLKAVFLFMWALFSCILMDMFAVMAMLEAKRSFTWALCWGMAMLIGPIVALAHFADGRV